MLKNLHIWLDYFQRNAGSEAHVPWREEEVLSLVESKRIARSIATFQLGENSEGRHLQKLASDFEAGVRCVERSGPRPSDHWWAILV